MHSSLYVCVWGHLHTIRGQMKQSSVFSFIIPSLEISLPLHYSLARDAQSDRFATQTRTVESIVSLSPSVSLSIPSLILYSLARDACLHHLHNIILPETNNMRTDEAIVSLLLHAIPSPETHASITCTTSFSRRRTIWGQMKQSSVFPFMPSLTFHHSPKTHDRIDLLPKQGQMKQAQSDICYPNEGRWNKPAPFHHDVPSIQSLAFYSLARDARLDKFAT